MKQKFRLTGVITLLLALQLLAYAGDKTLFIKGSGITRAGSTIANGSTIIFKDGANSMTLYVPGTQTPISDFAITGGKVDDKGSPAGRNVQVTCSVGDTLSATIWTPAQGAGNYYTSTSLGMSQANYDNSSLTWGWDGIAVDYKAAPPYPPTITQFAEATTTNASNNQKTSTLTISSGAGSGSDGLREVNGSNCEWYMWVDGQAESMTPVSGQTGQSLSLASDKVVPGTTYDFKVLYKNQWGSSEKSQVKSYTVAGAGGATGTLTPHTYYFYAPSATNNVVPTSMCLASLTLTKPVSTTISKASDLATIINNANGSKIVAAICKGDPATGALYSVIFNSDGSMVDPLTDFPLSAREPFQIYTTAAGSVEIQ